MEASREENLFDSLLATNSEITESLAHYHSGSLSFMAAYRSANKKFSEDLEQEVLRTRQEEADLSFAQERSVADAQLSRTGSHQTSIDTDQLEQAFDNVFLSAPMVPVASTSSASSRSSSQPPSTRRPPNDSAEGDFGELSPIQTYPPRSSLGSKNPYARFSTTDADMSYSTNEDVVDEPESLVSSPASGTNPSSQGSRLRRDDDEPVTPKEPSAKALGKLRRISGMYAIRNPCNMICELK